MAETKQEEMERIEALFSECTTSHGHLWDVDAGKCAKCERPFPYAQTRIQREQ